MGAAETRVADVVGAEAAAIRNPQSAIRNRAVAWVVEHEWVGVLGAAPLLLFPTPATAVIGAAVLGGLRVLAWRATGRWVPAGAPGVSALWLLGMALVGQAISLDSAVSLPRLAGLLLGLGVLYATALYTRRRIGGRGDVLPWAVLGGGLGLGLLMPLMVNWEEKAPAWLPPDVYTTWPGVFHNLLRDSLGRAQDGFAANAIAGMLALLLPPVAALATLPRGTGYPAPRLALIAGGVMSLSLLATQSRGGLLAAGVAVLLLLSWRFPRSAPWLAGASGLGLLGAGLALLATHGAAIAAALSGTPVETQSDTALFRLALWDRALQMIGDHPFTGVGLNNFPLVQQRLYPLFPTQPAALVIHAHNVYLQAALDFGVPGLVALLALGGTLAVTVLPGLRRPAEAGVSRDGRAPRAVWLAGCCAGLVAFAVYGLTDAMAIGSRPALLAWLLAGIAIGAAPLPAAERRGYSALATVGWATLSLALSVLAATVIPLFVL